MRKVALCWLIATTLCFAQGRRETAAAIYGEVSANYYAYWIHTLVPQLHPSATQLPENYIAKAFNQLDFNEQVNLTIFEVTTNYFGGEQSSQIQTMVGPKEGAIFARIAKANPKGFGDLCFFRGALVDDVLGNIKGISSIIPTIDDNGSRKKVSLSTTLIPYKSIPLKLDPCSLYAFGNSLGEKYWIDQMYEQPPAPELESLEGFYGKRYIIYPKRERLELAILILASPAYDASSHSQLNLAMKRDGPDLVRLLTATNVRKYIDSSFRKGDIATGQRLKSNVAQLLGYPLTK